MGLQILTREDFKEDLLLCNSLLEWSKNEPIPELHDDRVFVILLGAPGAGKSYFTKEFLMKYRKFKIVDPDEINKQRNLHGVNPDKSKINPKEAHKHISGNTSLVSNYIKKIISTDGKDSALIYDTTGSNVDNITEVSKIAKDNGYTTVLILIHRDLDSSKASAISRSHLTGRQVDTDYLESVYNKLSKVWKEYSKLENSYYLVDIESGKYNFWKMTNDKYMKKDISGWIDTEEPNLYRLEEPVLESKSTRSTIIDKDSFLNNVKKECSQYLDISPDKKLILYRGLNKKDDCLEIEPSNYKRESVGQESINYFGLLFDKVSSKLKWPSRYKSIIMTNDKLMAFDYGQVYIVIPKNDSDLIIAPSADFWLSFPELMRVGGFNNAVDLSLEENNKKIQNKLKALDLIGEIYMETKDPLFLPNNIFKGFDGKITFSEFLMKKIQESIDNNNWQHIISEELFKSKVKKSSEIWTDNKCYLIRKDYLITQPDLLKELGFSKKLL